MPTTRMSQRKLLELPKELEEKEKKLMLMEKELYELSQEIENNRLQLRLKEQDLNAVIDKMYQTKAKDLKEKEINLKNEHNEIKKLKEKLKNDNEKTIKEKLNELSKKEKDLNEKIGVLDTADYFKEFYSHIDQMYLLFIAAKGNPDGLFETIKMIIDARLNFADKKSTR
jgi:uncharacterized protein with gpF-like domain